MTARRKTYSADAKAAALVLLAVNRGNVSRTARESGIPRATLTDWASGRGAGERVTELASVKGEDLAARLEAAAHRCLDLMPGALAEASLRDLAITLGVAIDRMVSLRGCTCGAVRRRWE